MLADPWKFALRYREPWVHKLQRWALAAVLLLFLCGYTMLSLSFFLARLTLCLAFSGVIFSCLAIKVGFSGSFAVVFVRIYYAAGSAGARLGG